MVPLGGRSGLCRCPEQRRLHVRAWERDRAVIREGRGMVCESVGTEGHARDVPSRAPVRGGKGSPVVHRQGEGAVRRFRRMGNRGRQEGHPEAGSRLEGGGPESRATSADHGLSFAAAHVILQASPISLQRPSIPMFFHIVVGHRGRFLDSREGDLG